MDAGFLELAGDPDAICRRFSALCSDYELLRNYATKAHERAKTLSWEAFADKLSAVFVAMYEMLGFLTGR